MTARFDLRGPWLEALSRECRNSDRKGKSALLDEWSQRTGGMSSVRLKAMLPHLLSSASAETLPGYTPAIGARSCWRCRRARWTTACRRTPPSMRAAPAPHQGRCPPAFPSPPTAPLTFPVGTLEVDSVRQKNNSTPGVSCWTLNATGWADMMAMDSCSSDTVVFSMEKLLRQEARPDFFLRYGRRFNQKFLLRDTRHALSSSSIT